MAHDPPSTIARYRILSRLDAGGPAELYRAEDIELGRVVALKVFAARHAGDEERRRFREEARAAAAFDHPHIATLYDAGHEDGLRYLAMELVAGETLAERLERGPLAVAAALDIAAEVAAALDAAHRRNWIHRDITSSNLMLTPEGGVKVLDFGLASRPQIAGGETAGTPGYMAPEQIQGDGVDGRSDLFALGVVLYEMLSGRRPFTADIPAAVLRATVEQEAAPIARDGVPLALENVVRRLLAKAPEERYGTASELAADLLRMRRAVGGAAAEGADPGVALRPPSLGDASPPPGAAFRGLLPFHEADQDHFFGRGVEARALADRLSAVDCRFLVLYGESGCGKTSLLRAGLMPLLRQAGFLPLYCRGDRDPAAALVDEGRRQSGVKLAAGEPSLDYLRRLHAELAAGLVLIFDQFEEFFTHFREPREREGFLDFLSACHSDAGLPVKLLVALRSDFLYLIDAGLDGRIPEPLLSSKLYGLQRLRRAQAAEIIARSAQRARLGLEQALIRQVVKDLDAEGGAILPSELQIVGEQLQSQRLTTLTAYRQAGGKEALVHAYLKDVVRSSPQQAAARLLLNALISDENTRLALPLAEIAHRIQRSEAKTGALLRHFVAARLVREIQDEEPWRYELQHEYLIDKIHGISGRMMDARQRANRLFRRYLADQAADRRGRIPLRHLWLIHRCSDVPRSDRARALLAASLRWGVVKASGVALLLLAGAAWLSVREEWRGVRLRDGHTAAVRRAVFTPDGERLITGGEDGKVMVWDFVRRERLATLDGHQDRVAALAISPDGQVFASGDDRGRVMIWDAKALESLTVLAGHQSSLTALAFSPDGRWLAGSEYPPYRTLVWTTDSWEQHLQLPWGLTHGVLLFSGDSRQLQVNDRLYLLDDVGDRIDTLGHRYFDSRILTSSGLSRDLTQLVGVDSQGNVDFWKLLPPGDLRNSRLIARRRAHLDHGRAAAFSPDGRWAVSAAEDIVLWDAEDRNIAARLEHDAIVWDVTFSPDGRWLVSTHGDGAVLIWDMEHRRRDSDLREHSAPVRSIAFSPDGRRLASASEDRSLIIWDLESQRKETTLHGHGTRVNSVTFSAESQVLASLDQNGEVRVWDLATPGGARWRLSEPKGWGYAVAFSPDGLWMAAPRGVYDTRGRSLLVDFTVAPKPSAEGRVHERVGHGGIYGLAFSADGQRLAAATDLGGLSLLSVPSWEIVEQRQFPDSVFVTLDFSPGGNRLVTGEDEGAVRLWLASPLREETILGRHQARVKSVAFSPDGKWVASAGDDQEVLLWDVRRRKLVRRVGTHTAPTLAVAFSPDGRQLAVGGHDHSVRLYARHRSLWGFELR